MFCPNCGAEASDNAKFCMSCGTPLGDASEKAAAEPAQASSASQTSSVQAPAIPVGQASEATAAQAPEAPNAQAAEVPVAAAPEASEVPASPQTETPVAAPVAPQAANVAQAAPVASQKKKNKVPIIIAVIVVALLAIGGLAYAAISQGMFLSPADKVLLATSNTVNDQGPLTKTLATAGEIDQNNYTADVSFKADIPFGISPQLDLTYARDKSMQQAKGSFTAQDSQTIDFYADLKGSQLRLQFPNYSDSVLVYDYEKGSSGLDQLLQEDGDETIASLNSALAQLSNTEQAAEHSKEAGDILRKHFNDLTFESTKGTFTVNGAAQECEGYKTTMNGAWVSSLFDDILALYATDLNAALAASGQTLDDYTRELKDSFASMSDSHVTFYLYQNELAAVQIENDGIVSSLDFEGGAFRTQNMAILQNGQEIVRIKGTIENSIETIEVISGGEQVATLSYNTESGEYELSSYSEQSIKGELSASDSEFKFTAEYTVPLSSYFSYGDMKYSLSLQVSQGANFTEEPQGHEIDLTTASEEEISEFVEGILGKMRSTAYYE